jgi:hypothetical protein
VLVRILVDGVVEKIGANPAVIEQRIPFARRAVAADLLAVALGADQEVQQLPLRPLHLLAEFPVGLDVLQSFTDLTILQRDDAVAHRLRVVLSMAALNHHMRADVPATFVMSSVIARCVGRYTMTVDPVLVRAAVA